MIDSAQSIRYEYTPTAPALLQMRLLVLVLEIAIHEIPGVHTALFALIADCILLFIYYYTVIEWGDFEEKRKSIKKTMKNNHVAGNEKDGCFPSACALSDTDTDTDTRRPVSPR